MAIVRRRFGKAAERKEDAAGVAVGGDVVGIECERGAVTREGTLGVAEFQPGGAEVGMRIGEPRVQRERGAEMKLGLPVVPEFEIRGAEVGLGRGRGGIERERPAEPGQGARGPAPLAEHERAISTSHVAASAIYYGRRCRHAAANVPATKVRWLSSTSNGAATMTSLLAMPSAHAAMENARHFEAAAGSRLRTNA